MEKYAKELSPYAPFVLMTMEQGEAFREYDRNENKHDMPVSVITTCLDMRKA